MASSAYNGGAGGKFRKRPFNKHQSTPYERPLTALRPTQIINNNGWLSSIIDPASKFITAKAQSFFASVFRKRILSAPLPQPQPQLQPPEDEDKELKVMQPETATVVTSNTKVAVAFGGNAGSIPPENNGVYELEGILKQKTFTRSEIDHLTALLLSRNIENSDGRSAQKLSDLQTVLTRHDKLSDLSAHENRNQHLRSAVISTPELRSNVFPENVASPAEIAKAYMGRRPTNTSPSVFHLHNQMPKEDLSTPSNPLSRSSPVTSLAQKPLSVIGNSSNGLVTPRFRGRSAIYSMARTPYSRLQPVATFKAAETNLNTGKGLSNPNATDNDPIKRQVLKRRSSVLENDIGSVGPIRRIRQKPNLLHPKTSSLPCPRGRTSHVSGMVSDVAEVPSKEQSSQNCSSKLVAENNLPDTSSQYVPSQSIEMAQKIFDQLDKFSPKGNQGKKVDISVGMSPAKTTGIEKLNSMKPLQSSQDAKKFIGSVDSVHAPTPNHRLQTSSMVEEISVKSAIIGQDDTEGKKAVPCLSSKGKAAEYLMPAVDFPKKRVFRMSAHEDFLEVDDDLASNILFAEGRQNAESSRKSVAIPESPRKSVANPDTFLRDQPIVIENPPATKVTTQLGKSGLESLANGSSASEKTTGFPSVGSLSSPSTNLTLPDGVSAPQSTPKSDKIAPQNENSDIVTASSSKTDNLRTFVSTLAPKDTTLEAPVSENKAAAEVSGPDKSDIKSAPVFGYTAVKSGDAPSVGALSNGTHTKDVTLVNGVLSQSPANALFSSSSNSQTSVSISASSPPPSATSFKFFNGGVQPTFTLSTSTPGISSTSHTSLSVKAPSVSFASGFPSASTTLLTSSHITDESEAKLDTTGLDNASSSHLDAKPAAFSFQSCYTPVSAFAPFFLAQSASSVSAPSSIPVLSFTGQSVSSVSAPPLLSTPSFPVQSAPASLSTPSFTVQSASASLSTPIFPVPSASSVPAPTSTSALSFPVHSAVSHSASIFGLSGTMGSSSASIFGSFSGLGTAPAAMGSSSSISSSSSTASGIFGQTPKQTTTFTFGSSAAPSSSSAFGASTSSSAFGASTSSSAFGNTTGSLLFGATTNSSTASNNAPFIFGGTSGVAASSPAMTNSPFPSNASSQPFAFGSTPPPSNGQMTMEDTMAEDSSQPLTPPLAFRATPGFGATSFGAQPSFAHPSFGSQQAFGAPIPAPSGGGFAFSATPAAGSPYHFNTLPSQTTPQNPQLQPSGSLEFNNGGTGTNSFSLGTNDKSQRRIVRVKKTGRRK